MEPTQVDLIEGASLCLRSDPSYLIVFRILHEYPSFHDRICVLCLHRELRYPLEERIPDGSPVVCVVNCSSDIFALLLASCLRTRNVWLSRGKVIKSCIWFRDHVKAFFFFFLALQEYKYSQLLADD
jgi:hypothetical protein